MEKKNFNRKYMVGSFTPGITLTSLFFILYSSCNLFFLLSDFVQCILPWIICRWSITFQVSSHSHCLFFFFVQSKTFSPVSVFNFCHLYAVVVVRSTIQIWALRSPGPALGPAHVPHVKLGFYSYIQLRFLTFFKTQHVLL